MMTFENDETGKEIESSSEKTNNQGIKGTSAPKASPSWSEEKILKCVGSLHGWVFCLEEEKGGFNTLDSLYLRYTNLDYTESIFVF